MFYVRRLILVLSALIVFTGGTVLVAVRASLVGPSLITRWGLLSVFILLTILCVVWIIALWRRHTATIHWIRNQLRQFEHAERIGMIMVNANDELAELVTEINRYLTSIKFRFEKDRIEQKELQLQASVAETERRQAEAVISSISEAVIVTNRYDELLMANKSAQDLCDFSLELNYCLPIDQVLHESELLELFQHARLEKSPDIARSIELVHPETGKKLDLKVITSCVFDDQRQVVGVVMVIHDITAEREIARMKDDFVNSVSHELKTPLASIMAYAEMIADGEVEEVESRRKFCTIISEQAERLNRLIDDILNISRIESGSLGVSLRPLPLNEVIDEVITTIRPQARAKEIELEVEVESNDIVVPVDHDLIHQALLNLLSNALKYSSDRSKITLRLSRDDNDQAVIEVEDQGVGIPEDSLDLIFGKFYRVPEHNSMASGTGLGLHLVREVVRTVHHGDISVSSRPGSGSTFTITLPLCLSCQLMTSDFNM